MKICNINSVDTKGGAAKAAYRLHSSLNQLDDTSSTYLVKKKISTDETVKEYPKRDGYLALLKEKIYGKILKKEFEQYSKNKREDFEIFTDARTPFSDIDKQIPSDTDIINLHWIANFVDYQSFFNSCNLPVVWTLHDMNPFTGGCHYNIKCEKYKNECRECPQLRSQNKNDLSNKIWNLKEQVFSRFAQPLHFVTPSKWLKEEAEKSALLEEFPIHHIPNGINTDLYRPIEKGVAKSTLGIDSNANTVLFLADSTQNKRKGFTHLSKALQKISVRKNTVLLSVGQHKPDIRANVKQVHLGYVKNEYFLRIIYSAAEIFVIPSLQDNLPNTVLEAMACGTSSIGFEIGGIPDMIKEGQTGLLVNIKDGRGLKDAIDYLLKNEGKRDLMGENARKLIERKFNVRLQAKKYKQLYKEILS